MSPMEAFLIVELRWTTCVLIRVELTVVMQIRLVTIFERADLTGIWTLTKVQLQHGGV